MRKLTFALSTAALGLAAATAVSAQPMPHGDHMPKGDMTRAQAQQHAEEMFARMDANKDGTLNQADRAAHHAMMFDKIDTDRNGAISRAEFDAFHAKMAEHKGRMGGKMAHGGERHGGMMGKMGKMEGAATRQAFVARALAMFDKADANKDGTVTVAERQAARAAMRQQWQAARQQG